MLEHLIHDMLGNLFQWVEDCHNEGSLQGIATDGSPRTTGDCSQRVSRGGSWFDLPVFLRAAYRGMDTASGRAANLGFRIARTLNP